MFVRRPLFKSGQAVRCGAEESFAYEYLRDDRLAFPQLVERRPAAGGLMEEILNPSAVAMNPKPLSVSSVPH